MIRQITGCRRLLKSFRIQHPQRSIPASKVFIVRLQSSEPPDTKDFISDKKKININQENQNKQIFDDLVRSNKVVVFMKGTPNSPRCGFSNAVIQIFRMHGVPYDAHDVLADNELREGIKAYTDWPTIPQVFINGEFVGGCDILLEMHQSGDLVEHLKKVGIESELLRIHRQIDQKNKEKQKDNTKK